VPHNNKTTFLQIRITPKLAADLKQVAEQEANTSSAVVRRFLSRGVSLELKSAPRPDDDQEG
jgi:hypothetical protein